MSVDAIVETEIEFQDIHIKKPEKTISLESFIPPDNEDKKYSISENGRKGGGNTDVVDDIDGGGGDIGRTEKRITIKIDKKNTKPVQKQRAVAEPRASTKKGQLLKDVLKYRFDERVENINSSERHSSSISNKNNEMDMDIVEEKQTSSPITIDDVKSINDNNMDIDTNDIDINSESFSVFLQQKLIESFLKENSAAELQISSYHNFIEEKIPWIFNKYGSFDVRIADNMNNKNFEIRVKLIGKEVYTRPRICEDDGADELNYPHLCRIMKRDYVTKIKKNILIQIVNMSIENGERKEEILSETLEEGFVIMTLPVMVRSLICNTKLARSNFKDDSAWNKHLSAISKECENDEGGYFISNGSEKVTISQMSSAKNEIMIHTGANDDLYAEINSVEPDEICPFLNKLSFKFIKLARFIQISKLKNFEKKQDENILVCYFGVVDSAKCIPIPVLLRALGANSDLEISALICNDSFFLKSVFDSSKKSKEGENTENSYSILGCCKESHEIMNSINSSLYFCQEMSLTKRKKCLRYMADVLITEEMFGLLTNEQKLERMEYYLEHKFLPHISGRKNAKILQNPKFASPKEESDYKQEVEMENIVIRKEVQFQKYLFVAHMSNKYIRVFIKKDPKTDRDSLKSKTVEMCGDLMSIIFKNNLLKIKKDFQIRVTKTWEKKESILNILLKVVNANKRGMLYSMATGKYKFVFYNLMHYYARIVGNWCLNNKENQNSRNTGRMMHVGVTQVFNVQNYSSKQSSLSIVTTSGVTEQSKDARRRQLHTNSWGMLCPSDTPDGGKIGHVNHLAIAARCSFKVETSKIYGKILEINKEMNENIKRVKRDTVKKQSKLRQSIAEYVSKEKETMQQEEAAEAAAAANGGEIPKLTKSDDTQQQQQHEKQEKAEVKYANTVYHNYEASQNVIINYHEKTDLTYCIFTKEDLKLFLPESKIDKVFAQNRMNFINSLCSGVKIFLNMNWIGTTKNPHLFIQMCKRSKLHDETIPSNTFNLPKDCSISYESLEREIHIRANSGRLCRPLLVVENRKLKLTDTMIKEIVGEDSDSSSSSSNNSNNSNNSKKTRKEVENDGIFLKNFNPTEKKQQQQQQQQERLSSNGKKDFINRSTIRWKDLLDKGIIEILDVYEEDSSLISMFSSILDDNDKTKSVKTTPQYSHCEINASSILGFAASSIPFPQCNQSPRVIYQTGMDKQSQGVSTTKPKYRVDKSTQTLWYPQYPLVTTTVASSKKRKQIPSGINAIIAILCYTGYNQEDSVIFNQSSIDRGFFRAFSEMTVTDIEKTMNSGDNVERFCNPFNASVKHFRFSQRECAHLDELGLPAIGTIISSGMIVIGKIQIMTIADPYSPGKLVQAVRDLSTIWRTKISQRVQDVILTTNEKGEKIAHVKLLSVREPQIGDKVATRHAQKGTLGITYQVEDMPFTREGIIPDAIINPHCIPSRMTIGQLVEQIGGVVGACLGQEILATPFMEYASLISRKDGKNNGEILCGLLGKCGYCFDGTQVMYHGHTSKMIPQRVFIGMPFYQRLRHNADDKIQARSRGPTTLLTRQPTHGKVRDGGGRFGEMERDCIISHGAAMFIHDRTMTCSDEYEISIHNRCGFIAIHNKKTNRFTCKLCGNKDVFNFTVTKIPYSMKLLIQELMSMSLAPRLFL